MKKLATILAFLCPFGAGVAAARADVPGSSSLLAQGPPVQVAPPAQRPYGTTYGRPTDPALPPRPLVLPPQAPVCPPSPYSELRIAPAYGGTAWLYDGTTLVGRVDPGYGSVYLPVSRAYGVVVTRGDQIVWQGHVMATPGTVNLAWDRYGSPVVDRAPPPPQALGACAPYGAYGRPPPPPRY